jgi:pimeloyl-ACP methyl ester carboxylesterase
MEDLVFTEAMLDDLEQNYCVDTARVFVTGHSWGGDMAAVVACFLGDRVRAAAPAAANRPYWFEPDSGEFSCVGSAAVWTFFGVADDHFTWQDYRCSKDDQRCSPSDGRLNAARRGAFALGLTAAPRRADTLSRTGSAEQLAADFIFCEAFSSRSRTILHFAHSYLFDAPIAFRAPHREHVCDVYAAPTSRSFPPCNGIL